MELNAESQGTGMSNNDKQGVKDFMRELLKNTKPEPDYTNPHMLDKFIGERMNRNSGLDRFSK